MIKDITIGQYFPADSIIHKLDPRTKIIITFLYILALFIGRSFIAYFIVLVFLAILIKVSKVPLGFILKGLKAIMIIIIITVAINVFMTPGETRIYKLGFLIITLEGLILAALMAIRLIFLIVGSSVLTLTTSPIELTDGIESLLKPLEKIKVPAHEIAMMMTIALRFIPILLEETDKIMKAQMARGADFETGGLIKKAKSLIPILVPLFISSFRRADELALAMEARCYRGGEGRTRMNKLHYGVKDLLAFTAILLFYCFIIGVKIAQSYYNIL